MPEIKTKIFERAGTSSDAAFEFMNWFFSNHNIVIVDQFTQFAVLGRDNQTITVRYFLKEDA